MVPPRLDRTCRATRDTAATAGDMRDPWGPSKLARHDHHHLTIETALVYIFNLGRDGLIKGGQTKLERVKDVMIHGMVIPVRDSSAQWAVKLRGDDFHSRLNQTPR